MERLCDLRVVDKEEEKKMGLCTELGPLLFGGKSEFTALSEEGFTEWGVNRV